MRLTEKLSEDLPIYFAKDGKDEDETNTKSIIQKLGQLEDIEEELGIDLVTLFKALKNGVYYRQEIDDNEYSAIQYTTGNNLCIDDLGINFMNYYEIELIGYFKDYGKTWALTKEELE